MLFRNRLDHLLAKVLRLVEVLRRDLFDVVFRAERLVAENERLHLHEIDDTLELIFGADRKLERNSVLPELLANLIHDRREVRANTIHLVDEGNARHAVLVGLTPHGLRLRLDAADRAKNSDRTVEDAERALHFDSEVDVTRSVDDIDARVAPHGGGGGRRDRDAALLLLDHPVHGCSALVHLADFVSAAGVIEDALRRRGFTRVDVSHDPDVSRFFERYLTCHVFPVS